jgi:phosphohistidine swiveling domain-containing protein
VGALHVAYRVDEQREKRRAGELPVVLARDADVATYSFKSVQLIKNLIPGFTAYRNCVLLEIGCPVDNCTAIVKTEGILGFVI